LGPDLFGYQYVIGRIDCLRARPAKLSSGSGKRQAKNLMDQDREITREETASFGLVKTNEDRGEGVRSI
jgi:hypothetical protein